MTPSLRILVKRNGEKVVQKRTCRYDQEPCNCPDEIATWKDLPIVYEEQECSSGSKAHEPEEEKCICKTARFGEGIPITFRPTCKLEEIVCARCDESIFPKTTEPEKSLGQVAHDAYWDKGGSEFSELSIYMVNLWEKVSQAVLSEARKRGWKEPDNAS